jgi:hypothetical protein
MLVAVRPAVPAELVYPIVIVGTPAPVTPDTSTANNTPSPFVEGVSSPPDVGHLAGHVGDVML